MSTIVEFIKTKVVAVATTFTVLGTVVGGVIAVESRYAKAADISDLKQQQVQIYSNMKIQQEIAVDTLRRQNIEDKLFELRLKDNPSRADQALIERYREQLQELNVRFDANKRSLQRLE
jgi:hypothetical protein